MRIISLEELRERQVPSVATIGFFDGVHRGHRFLISQVVESARGAGMASLVVTFASHPRGVFRRGGGPPLLCPLEEKVRLLGETGVDFVLVLDFDGALSTMSAREFMAGVLRKAGVRRLVMGYDNRFGHRGAVCEGFAEYARYGRELGIEVVSCGAYDEGEVRVSSSQVRQFLLDGCVGRAAECLGRVYELTGRVVGGEHIGTGLGFPTANLEPFWAEQLVPAAGVYAVRVRLESACEFLGGMMNIGRRPTFGGEGLTLEVHIFRFRGDIYGRRLTVGFVGRLRSEMRFEHPGVLRAQLQEDAARAEKILNECIDL